MNMAAAVIKAVVLLCIIGTPSNAAQTRLISATVKRIKAKAVAFGLFIPCRSKQFGRRMKLRCNILPVF